MLSLLSAVAEERPLVCLVDDGQWLDRSSAQTLEFVARRLTAEPVAMVFAVRDSDEEPGLAGLPELAVPGLRSADAAALLRSTMTGRLEPRQRTYGAKSQPADAAGHPVTIGRSGLSVAEQTT